MGGQVWVTTVPLLLVVLYPSPAAAGGGTNPCTYKGQIFVRSTSARDNTLGTTNRIVFRQRDLDDNCQADAKTLSTANVARDFSEFAPSGDWVEIGWQQYWSASTPTTAIFTEKGYNFQIQELSFFPSVLLELGTEDKWRVAGQRLPNGTAEWSLRVDYMDGGGWHTPKVYQTNWNKSVALGETERVATGSGMADEQSDLKFFNLTRGDWEPWPGMNCVQDTDGSWNWVPVTSNSYKVVRDGLQC